jgi:hypothetical protein
MGLLAAVLVVHVTLSAKGLAFRPAVVNAGPVVFRVANRDRATRTFSVRGRRIRVRPGHAASLRATLGASGFVQLRSGTDGGVLGVVVPCTNPVASTVTVRLAQDNGGLTMSPARVPCGTVTFVVTDAGSLEDSLNVFADLPAVHGSTPVLQPGQTARVTVTFRARGTVHLESGTYPPAEPEYGGDYGEEARLALT